MKKFLMLVLLVSNLVSISFATEKMDSYDKMLEKEQKMRDLERENFEKEQEDTYEGDLKKEEELERKEIEKEEKKRELEREPRYIEVKDDAGYDKNNMDKVREAGHRAWDKLQDGFDKGNK